MKERERWVHEWTKEKKSVGKKKEGKKKWKMKNGGNFMREYQKFWKKHIATF